MVLTSGQSAELRAMLAADRVGSNTGETAPKSIETPVMPDGDGSEPEAVNFTVGDRRILQSILAIGDSGVAGAVFMPRARRRRGSDEPQND